MEMLDCLGGLVGNHRTGTQETAWPLNFGQITIIRFGVRQICSQKSQRNSLWRHLASAQNRTFLWSSEGRRVNPANCLRTQIRSQEADTHVFCGPVLPSLPHHMAAPAPGSGTRRSHPKRLDPFKRLVPASPRRNRSSTVVPSLIQYASHRPPSAGSCASRAAHG